MAPSLQTFLTLRVLLKPVDAFCAAFEMKVNTSKCEVGCLRPVHELLRST